MNKKHLLIALAIVLTPMLVFAQFTVPQGGTGRTTYPNGALFYFDGTRITATSSQPLYVGSIVATSTLLNTLPYASSTAFSSFYASSTFGNYGTLTVPNLTSAMLLTNGSGVFAEYAGTSCTNQFVRSLSALGAATCATVSSSDVSLANLTATDSTLTFSGTYNGATARTIGLNLGNANTWTVNQTFNYSSSTIYSSFVTSSTTNAFFGTGQGFAYIGSLGRLNVVASTSAGFLLDTGDVGTGNYDFGGATFFEIPNGTGPTADDPGEIAHDTTDNQLILDDFVVGKATNKIWSVTVASTSTYFIGETNLAIPTQLDGYTMTAIRCHVVSGTSKAIQITDGTNATESITCATTVTSDDGTITNAGVTAAELMYIDFGATTGAVDTVSISVFGTWTRE